MQVYTLRINSSKFPVVVILCRKNFDQGNKHYIFKFKSAHIEHQDQEFQIKYSSHCQKQTGCSCIPYCSSVSSPGQSFFLEQRVVRSPLGDQHRTHTLQTSSSGRQQSFSGFFLIALRVSGPGTAQIYSLFIILPSLACGFFWRYMVSL